MFAKMNMAKGKSNLPPRGTGLRTGRAGPRRYGRPRTDEEREERHRRVMTAEQGWERDLGIRGKANPWGTSPEYEEAKSMIDAEFDEASHDLGMVLDSMGWSRPPRDVLKRAQEHFRTQQAPTKEDYEGLAEIIDEEGESYESDEAQDYVANLVAEYIDDSLKAAGAKGKGKASAKALSSYTSRDFEVLKGAQTGDPRIAYTFRSKDGNIEANLFWQPGDVEMRGLVGETGTVYIVYPGGGRGTPPAPDVFLRSLIVKLKRGEID